MNGEPMKTETLERAESSVLLTHEGGLHARPAIKVTQLAKRFDSDVKIGASEDGPWRDAKSVATVMAMKTPVMTTLYFRATGSDAEQAVNALRRLVESDFTDMGSTGV